MLMPRIIPCLDIRDGRVVKGVQFENLRDAGDPGERAAAYCEQGADELVLLDVSATLEGRRTTLATVRRVRAELSIPLTVGGGVRGLADAEALLDAGADKVAINTAAVEQPDRLDELADRLGRQCVVLSIDARRVAGGFRVLTHSGSNARELEPGAWAATGARRGAGEILLTSHDRDGTRRGYDLELLRAVRREVNLPLIASGGGASVADMVAALDAGADAVLAASIFHDEEMTVGDLKSALAERGVEARR
jgi:imidazole glycerol-phosphate synthase subunit HisF